MPTGVPAGFARFAAYIPGSFCESLPAIVCLSLEMETDAHDWVDAADSAEEGKLLL